VSEESKRGREPKPPGGAPEDREAGDNAGIDLYVSLGPWKPDDTPLFPALPGEDNYDLLTADERIELGAAMQHLVRYHWKPLMMVGFGTQGFGMTTPRLSALRRHLLSQGRSDRGRKKYLAYLAAWKTDSGAEAYERVAKILARLQLRCRMRREELLREELRREESARARK
jgi:hypothetical protein